MAEVVRLVMDDGTGSEYDALMAESRRGGLPDGGDLQVVTKDNGMTNGAAIVMLTFTVGTKFNESGQAVETKRVQTCTSVRNLMEKFYIVGVRGVPGGISIAGDEASAKGCGEDMVNDFLSRR